MVCHMNTPKLAETGGLKVQVYVAPSRAHREVALGLAGSQGFEAPDTPQLPVYEVWDVPLSMMNSVTAA